MTTGRAIEDLEIATTAVDLKLPASLERSNQELDFEASPELHTVLEQHRRLGAEQSEVQRRTVVPLKRYRARASNAREQQEAVAAEIDTKIGEEVERRYSAALPGIQREYLDAIKAKLDKNSVAELQLAEGNEDLEQWVRIGEQTGKQVKFRYVIGNRTWKPDWKEGDDPKAKDPVKSWEFEVSAEKVDDVLPNSGSWGRPRYRRFAEPTYRPPTFSALELRIRETEGIVVPGKKDGTWKYYFLGREKARIAVGIKSEICAEHRARIREAVIRERALETPDLLRFYEYEQTLQEKGEHYEHAAAELQKSGGADLELNKVLAEDLEYLNTVLEIARGNLQPVYPKKLSDGARRIDYPGIRMLCVTAGEKEPQYGVYRVTEDGLGLELPETTALAREYEMQRYNFADRSYSSYQMNNGIFDRTRRLIGLEPGDFVTGSGHRVFGPALVTAQTFFQKVESSEEVVMPTNSGYRKKAVSKTGNRENSRKSSPVIKRRWGQEYLASTCPNEAVSVGILGSGEQLQAFVYGEYAIVESDRSKRATIVVKADKLQNLFAKYHSREALRKAGEEEGMVCFVEHPGETAHDQEKWRKRVMPFEN